MLIAGFEVQTALVSRSGHLMVRYACQGTSGQICIDLDTQRGRQHRTCRTCRTLSANIDDIVSRSVGACRHGRYAPGEEHAPSKEHAPRRPKKDKLILSMQQTSHQHNSHCDISGLKHCYCECMCAVATVDIDPH
jgi:hypothetical protein